MRWRAIALVLALLVLAGCGSTGPAPVVNGNREDAPATYRVARGDTLYAIAFRFGLDYRQIAQWNRLKSPDRIIAGQTLRLHPPGARPAPARATPPTSSTAIAQRSPSPPPASAPAPVARQAPPPAAPVASSNSGTRTVAASGWRWPTDGNVVSGFDPDVPGHKGIQIAGQLGQTVRAASPGTVVYSGSGLPGYGRLIILKHPNNLLSAYGYLGKINVKEGDAVQIGQVIAELGAASDNRPLLHFEIRENGSPVNPMRYLPT